MTTDRAMYSVREFCRRNSIGKTTFYELVKAGSVVTVKVGSHTLVPAASESAWHASLGISSVYKPVYKNIADLSERKRTRANRVGHE